jgi:uncharacterized YigZ family protein
MVERYRTLTAGGTGMLREKASRFLGIAFPTRDEGSFRERLAELQHEHHDARHFCYAWVMGADGARHRANDAGEPAGTAGRPILDRIRGARLTDTAVVVVRWFGGTLLGRSGLIQAYGSAAALALEQAPVVEVLVRERLRLRCGYAHVERVRAEVAAADGLIVHAAYTASCALEVELPLARVEALLATWRLRGIDVQREATGK